MSFFSRNSRLEIYKSDWLNLYIDNVTTKSGKNYDKYHVIEIPKKSVGCVVVNDNHEILLVKAYRYIQEESDWEIPAGSVETNETIRQAAQRECLEETGYSVVLYEDEFSFYPTNGISNQEFYIFYGQLNDNIPRNSHDINEIEEVRWFTKEQIMNMIKANSLKDGLSLTALLLYFFKL